MAATSRGFERYRAEVSAVKRRWLKRPFYNGGPASSRRANLKFAPQPPRVGPPAQALNELPQPQVDLTLGLLNLKPEPSKVST